MGGSTVCRNHYNLTILLGALLRIVIESVQVMLQELD